MSVKNGTAKFKHYSSVDVLTLEDQISINIEKDKKQSVIGGRDMENI